MKLTWEKIRLLVIHEWHLEMNATEAAHKLNRAWAKAATERATKNLFGNPNFFHFGINRLLKKSLKLKVTIMIKCFKYF